MITQERLAGLRLGAAGPAKFARHSAISRLAACGQSSGVSGSEDEQFQYLVLHSFVTLCGPLNQHDPISKQMRFSSSPTNILAELKLAILAMGFIHAFDNTKVSSIGTVRTTGRRDFSELQSLFYKFQLVFRLAHL